MGGRFWIGVIGSVLAVAVGVGVVLWVLGAALVAWGLLGAFLFVSAIALAFGWFYDRRQPPPLDPI